MHIIVNNVIYRLDVPDLLRVVKYSTYPWYDEVGVVVNGADQSYIGQPDITHVYGSIGSNRIEFQLIDDPIPASNIYVDPGATAYDPDTDTYITVNISTTVDQSVLGTTEIIYTAVDADGLEAIPISRTVTVQ